MHLLFSYYYIQEHLYSNNFYEKIIDVKLPKVIDEDNNGNGGHSRRDNNNDNYGDDSSNYAEEEFEDFKEIGSK